MRRVFQHAKPDVVIHTASPKFDTPNSILYKVNVEGTKTLIQVAKEVGSQSFVYTSSASVISDAKADLKNADESFPVYTPRLLRRPTSCRRTIELKALPHRS
jgi:sterol-4alpha-carboxylate 3-dehydrogenase (decarboxylating)